ncbi:hypothetical protein [Longispora urticae]
MTGKAIEFNPEAFRDMTDRVREVVRVLEDAHRYFWAKDQMNAASNCAETLRSPLGREILAACEKADAVLSVLLTIRRTQGGLP